MISCSSRAVESLIQITVYTRKSSVQKKQIPNKVIFQWTVNSTHWTWRRRWSSSDFLWDKYPQEYRPAQTYRYSSLLFFFFKKKQHELNGEIWMWFFFLLTEDSNFFLCKLKHFHNTTGHAPSVQGQSLIVRPFIDAGLLSWLLFTQSEGKYTSII